MGKKKIWRNASIIAGGLIGAVVGTIAAFILVKSSKNVNQSPRLTAKRSIQIGKNILSLIRSIAEIGKGQK